MLFPSIFNILSIFKLLTTSSGKCWLFSYVSSFIYNYTCIFHKCYYNDIDISTYTHVSLSCNGIRTYKIRIIIRPRTNLMSTAYQWDTNDKLSNTWINFLRGWNWDMYTEHIFRKYLPNDFPSNSSQKAYATF